MDHTSEAGLSGGDRTDSSSTAEKAMARGHALQRLIRPKVSQARLAILWERLWPLIVPILIIVGLFLTVSWIGLWEIVPETARLILLVAFAGLLLWAFARIRFLAIPTHEVSRSRVERLSGMEHRPLAALDDELVSGHGDSGSSVLWKAHRERTIAALKNLKAGMPEPRVDRLDPYALRFVVLLMVVGSFLFAGDSWLQRINSAFSGPQAAVAPPPRIDAWISPPAYTNRAPIFLTGTRAGDALGVAMTVPEGSQLIVRTDRSAAVSVVAEIAGQDRLAETTGEDAGTGPTKVSLTQEPVEHRLTLDADAVVHVKRGTEIDHVWRLSIEPDHDPAIALAGEPVVAVSGALELNYTVEDDYGVIGAEARFEAIETVDPASVFPALRQLEGEARPLITAPDYRLNLPRSRTKKGEGKTIRDLTAHPWAGSQVNLSLAAVDEAGQEGVSERTEMKLPQRLFSKQLARALVEQRRILALDARTQHRVVSALDAMMIAPERFIKNGSVYLGMTVARTRLVRAKTDDELREVVDMLWDIALGVEDGDLSQAERDLRAAQERLREALENGASEDEIRRLTQELRQAMNNYLQELARQAMQNQNGQQMRQLDPNTQVLRQQDLQKLLDRIEELARTGANEAAQQLLSQLQQMLENLQMARPGQMNQMQGNQEMSEALNELGEMIMRQQELMDQTFRMSPDGGIPRSRTPGGNQQQGGQRPMTPEELEQALRGLGQNQDALRQRLQEMMKRLEEMGLQPGESGELGQAGQAMGEATESLNEGQAGEAVGEQGRALDALRNGARQMAEQMMGEGGADGQAQNGQDPSRDPLGRPRRTRGPEFGDNVRVPDEIDTQRAREILQEIRRRLSERGRIQLELDYLERLLERF